VSDKTVAWFNFF